MVELSSKFGALPGEAVQLITCAHDHGLTVEGVSFHVGSQCTNPENYIQAIHLSAGIFAEAKSRGCLLYTSPSPRDRLLSRMPSSA